MAIIRCEKCGALNSVADDLTTEHPLCGLCNAMLDTSAAPRSIRGAALDQAIASSLVPVLVDFWAKWCGPCRTLAPHIEALAQQYAGKLLVLRLDVDADSAAAQRYGVQALPTLVLFRDGQEVGRKIGAISRSELNGWIAGELG
jgi:thioredoxin 2